jgi:hypothetical protein
MKEITHHWSNPHILSNLMIYYCAHKSLPQMNPVHALLSFMFSQKKTLYAPTLIILFDLITSIIFGEEYKS